MCIKSYLVGMLMRHHIDNTAADIFFVDTYTWDTKGYINTWYTL